MSLFLVRMGHRMHPVSCADGSCVVVGCGEAFGTRTAGGSEVGANGFSIVLYVVAGEINSSRTSLCGFVLYSDVILGWCIKSLQRKIYAFSLLESCVRTAEFIMGI